MGLRAEFINRNAQLIPGEFVRARIRLGERVGGMLIPQSAVQMGQNGPSVMVIDSEGNAEMRPITVGPMAGTNWIVEDGLRVGDVVITSNLQQLRPGMPVTRRQGAQRRVRQTQEAD